MIVAVALRRPSGFTIQLPLPARLADVVAWLDETGHGGDWTAECTQGFVTTEGQFLERPAALALVRRTGQRVEDLR
jgi:hypothetical protein